MTMPRLSRFLMAALVAPSLLIVSAGGCGNSGANVKPTIVAKPANRGAGGGASANGNAASSENTAGGNTADNTTPPAATSSGGTGTFSGRVVFKGSAPAVELLVKKGDPAAKDAAVCAAMDVPNEQLVVGADGGIANVFLFLAKAPAGGKGVTKSDEPIIFDQKNCRFIPHALALETGRTVKVLNDDAVLHNTHSYPVNGSNSAINSGIKPNDREGIALTYTAPEKVPLAVKCDIHPFMIAYHLPVNHPYFAVTDASGKFEIKDLPAGDHEFVVWQEKKGFLERKYKVTVVGGQAVEKELSYDAAAFAKFDGPEPKTIVVRASR